MRETWNYIGKTRKNTADILLFAVDAVIGSSIRVAPFNRTVLSKLGVWLQGDSNELEKIRETLDKRLKKAKILFHSMKWEGDKGR